MLIHTRMEGAGEGSGELSYEWRGDWATIPNPERARLGWAHPGMTVSPADEVFTFHSSDPLLLAYDRDGRLLRSVAVDVTEGHGLTWAGEGAAAFLWLADTGAKRQPPSYDYGPGRPPGQVLKLALDGQVVQRLGPPDLPVYAEGKCSPTSVAVGDARHGGSGELWVADGYGQSLVHRYRLPAGEYLGSISGESGAGRFNCPHGIWIDTRRSEPELYVADRGNHRIQVFDLAGAYKRVVGAEFLTSPSGFASWGDYLIVAELRARLAILDRDDRLVGYLGSNAAVCQEDGWPNMKDGAGTPTRTDRLVPGRFNSPHGIAADSAGNIYVGEWLIGGRTTKLTRVEVS